MPVVVDDAAAIHYRSAMFVLIRIVAVDCTIRRRVRDEFAIGYDHVSLICDYTVIGATVGPEYAIGHQEPYVLPTAEPCELSSASTWLSRKLHPDR